METYTTLEELENKYFTTKELFRLLAERGFASNIHSLRRWENVGIIPKPKRVRLKNSLWRVYEKDGSDFEKIFASLEGNIRKLVNIVT